jgi:hypothetical protein
MTIGIMVVVIIRLVPLSVSLLLLYLRGARLQKKVTELVTI